MSSAASATHSVCVVMQYGVMGIAIVFSMAVAGVVVGGILAGSVDPPDADLWKALRWSAVSFACVIAPALVAWLTWRRLTRYMPLVPLQAKRLLLNAADVYILLGFLAVLFAIDGL